MIKKIKFNIIFKLGLFGFLFGCCFPIMSWIFDFIFRGYSFSFYSVSVIHQLYPLHYIIDTAPLFLGVAFTLIGYKQARVQHLNANLEKLVQSKTEELFLKSNHLEHAYVKISQSIDYAQHIQSTILPQEKQLNELFTEAMMIYLPKDKVSGDFPWLFRKGDNLFIAAVDCTGHGVPGALLSVVGHFLLNQVVLKPTVKNSADILNALHAEIVETLKQHHNDNSNDGMDIALCQFNLKNSTLNFAGANRHLYLLRNSEITEYRGDKRPIGGIEYQFDEAFKNNEITLQKNDTFYFYTDGFSDQLGGAEQKKFFNSRIKNLILNHQGLSMHEQKEVFTNTFNLYKGNLEQTDDVFFVGLKI